MWSYVYWLGMDKDIENMVKSCRSCASVAKAPPIKFNPMPKTDKPLSRLHTDYAGPIKGCTVGWGIHRLDMTLNNLMVRFQ